MSTINDIEVVWVQNEFRILKGETKPSYIDVYIVDKKR